MSAFEIARNAAFVRDDLADAAVLVRFEVLVFLVFITSFHAFWCTLRCQYWFYSSKAQTAMVCVLSVVLTFLFLSSEMFDCFDLSTSS
jgi:hypothetical protein